MKWSAAVLLLCLAIAQPARAGIYGDVRGGANMLQGVFTWEPDASAAIEGGYSFGPAQLGLRLRLDFDPRQVVQGPAGFVVIGWRPIDAGVLRFDVRGVLGAMTEEIMQFDGSATRTAFATALELGLIFPVWTKLFAVEVSADAGVLPFPPGFSRNPWFGLSLGVRVGD